MTHREQEALLIRIRGVLAQGTDPQRTVEIIARLVGMRVEQQRVVFVKGDA